MFLLAIWCSTFFSGSSFVSSTNLDPLSCIPTTVFSVDFSSANGFLSSYLRLSRTRLIFFGSNGCISISSVKVSRCLFLVSLDL